MFLLIGCNEKAFYILTLFSSVVQHISLIILQNDC